MKVTIVSHNLSSNALGRAFILAQALRRFCEVEITGVAFDSLWPPLDMEDFHHRAIDRRTCSGMAAFHRLLQMLDGDVVYAIKPRPFSYGAALLHRIASHRPLVVDVDDSESGFLARRGWRATLRSGRELRGRLGTMLMERLVCQADACTVASRFLQTRFGGVLVPHGRDTTVFDPNRFDRDTIRRRWGITTEPLILFLGTPRPWKGLDDLVAAVQQVQHPALKLMLVGTFSDSGYGQSLAAQLPPGRLILVPSCPFSEAPRFLAMADLVIIPQRRSLASLGQVPAKVFDAMAMARPIVATDVSDLPEILEHCGIAVPAGRVDRIAQAIDWVLEHPTEATRMGQRARQKCIEHYSLDMMEQVLRGIFLPLGKQEE